MTLKNNAFLLFLALLGAPVLHATHNIGGEILYRKTGPLTVEAWIVTYTNANAVNADRDTLVISWGDGSFETLQRANGNGEGELITPQYKRNFYIGTHTYTQEGQFTISMTDPNRSAGILNINAPASDNVPFHLQSTVRFLPDAAGSLFSPVLLEIPIDGGIIGQPFEHVLNAFDSDGDSLSFEFAIPLQSVDDIVPNYVFPTDIAPGTNNVLTIDPVTGKIVWDAPQYAGAYTIAILIKSYRNGQLVESVIRDMLIYIDLGLNTPPVVQLSVPDSQVIDVHVGDTVLVDMTVSDANAGQVLELSSTSGLYDYFQDSAQFTLTGLGSARFVWVVTQEHLRDQPYLVSFKAKDDGLTFAGGPLPDSDAELGLATFKVAQFRVRQTVSVRPGLKDAATLRIYPNPVSGEGQVAITLPASGNLRLRILNVQGAVVQDERVLSGAATPYPLRLANLPAAIYLVQVADANGAVWSGRVVKQ